MDVQEAKLREKMQGTGVSVTRNGDNIVLNMPNNVTFDSSSANLKPAGANTLTGVAMVLKEYEKTAVNVVGYTDSTGSQDLNMRLSSSARRASPARLLPRAWRLIASAQPVWARRTRSPATARRKAKRRTAALKLPSARCSNALFARRLAGQNA